MHRKGVWIRVKITTKGRYAIHILYDLAVNGTEHPVSVKEIATRQEISVKYTEQIISILNKAGYVSSSRGFQGGYRLTKSLEEYVIGDVLRLTEGSLAPVECLASGKVECPKHGQCATILLWEKVDKAIRDVVDNVTLAELVAWQQA